MKRSANHKTLGEIAAAAGGTIVKGDPAGQVDGICALDAPLPGCIAFFNGKSVRALSASDTAKLGGLIVSGDLGGFASSLAIPVISVSDPLAAMVRIIPLFYSTPVPPPGVHARAEIDPSAEIGPEVSIGPFVSIGPNVRVGRGTIIHPQAVIYPGVEIGERCVLHAGCVIREFTKIGADVVIQPGAVIGADGFGYYLRDGELAPVPQVGITKLADKVEVGANACIDRATLGQTSVSRGTKIDNLVQVGHNVQIGAQSLLCGLAGIGGSVKIGSGVVIGGGAGIADHLTVADGCRVAGHAGVASNLTERGDYAGYPAENASSWRRQMRALTKLPALIRQLRKGEE